MYEELISRLLSLSEIDAIPQKSGICRITMECIGAIKEIAIEAADAIEELEKKNEQLTKKLVRPRPPKRKACSCGKKKWKQWYHTDTGMWSLQCDNCGKSSRQVKYQSQLNAAWNEIADSEIDP